MLDVADLLHVVIIAIPILSRSSPISNLWRLVDARRLLRAIVNFRQLLLLLRCSAHLHICLEPTSSHVRCIVPRTIATPRTDLGQSRGTCRSARLHPSGRIGLTVIMSCTAVGCVHVARTFRTSRCAGVSSTISCPPNTRHCPVPTPTRSNFDF